MKSSRDAAFGLVILVFLTCMLLFKNQLWAPLMLLFSIFVGLPVLDYLVLRRMVNDRVLRGTVLAAALSGIVVFFSSI